MTTQHALYLRELRADSAAAGQCAYCPAPAWRKPDGSLARLCRDHLDADNARGRPRTRRRWRLTADVEQARKAEPSTTQRSI
jgi:hypothetical protein